jgi:hypothetical protein
MHGRRKVMIDDTDGDFFFAMPTLVWVCCSLSSGTSASESEGFPCWCVLPGEYTKKGSWKWSSAADESAQICTEGTPKTMQILTQLLIRMWMFDPSWSYDYSLRAQSEPLASNQQPTTVTTAIITTEGQYLPSHSIIREGRWKRERGCALPHLLRFVIKMLSDTAEQHKPATR